MNAEPETFSPLCVTLPTETVSQATQAELLDAQDMLTALCDTKDGIAAWATLLGYGKVAPSTKSDY